MGNDARKRPMVTMTLAPATIVALDAMKGTRGRGEIVDELVAAYVGREKKQRGPQ